MIFFFFFFFFFFFLHRNNNYCFISLMASKFLSLEMTQQSNKLFSYIVQLWGGGSHLSLVRGLTHLVRGDNVVQAWVFAVILALTIKCSIKGSNLCCVSKGD